MVELNEDMYYLPPRLINGIPSIFWSVYWPNIRLFINEEKLKPMLTQEQLFIMEHEPKIIQKELVIRPIPFPGGLLGPHLHYKGECYLLSKEQWNKFSKPILKEISNKLARAGTVPFVQLMELTEPMIKMGDLNSI